LAIVRSVEEIEDWLDAEAAAWSPISDPEYKAIRRGWQEHFGVLAASVPGWLHGHRALAWLREQLPADVLLFNGVLIPRLANMGGGPTTGYQARGLRHIRRNLANQYELIVVSADFSWTCVFSHEAESLVWEELYVTS
jgi:hypothetical protein